MEGAGINTMVLLGVTARGASFALSSKATDAHVTDIVNKGLLSKDPEWRWRLDSPEWGSHELWISVGKGASGVVYAVKSTRTGEEFVVKTIRVLDPNDLESAIHEIAHASRLCCGISNYTSWYDIGRLLSMIQHATVSAKSRRGVLVVPSKGEWTWDELGEVVRSNGSLTFGLWMGAERGSMTLTDFMVALHTDRLESRSGLHGVLTGTSLFKHLKSVCLSLVEAVGLVHKAGFVHRDIKPDNILVVWDTTTGSYHSKLIDWGVSSELSGPISDERLDETLGTPRFMHPLMVIRRSENAYTTENLVEADLYAVAMTIINLMTATSWTFWGTLQHLMSYMSIAYDHHDLDIVRTVGYVVGSVVKESRTIEHRMFDPDDDYLPRPGTELLKYSRFKPSLVPFLVGLMGQPKPSKPFASAEDLQAYIEASFPDWWEPM